LLNLGIVNSKLIIYSCFSSLAITSKPIIFILGSNLLTFKTIFSPITVALGSLTGKKSKSPKLIPKVGLSIFSPGDVVIKLMNAFLIASKLLDDSISNI